MWKDIWRPREPQDVSRGPLQACNCLRSFFRYAELRGWVGKAIAQDINGPRVPRYAAAAQGPTWTDVRRLLESKDEGSSHREPYSRQVSFRKHSSNSTAHGGQCF